MVTLEKTFEKQIGLPVPAETEANRLDLLLKAVAERHKKSDTDGTRRRDRQTAEDNRLL